MSLRRRRAAVAALIEGIEINHEAEIGDTVLSESENNGSSEAEVAASSETGGGSGIAPSDPADQDDGRGPEGLPKQPEAELGWESGELAAELEEAGADGAVGADDEVIED